VQLKFEHVRPWSQPAGVSVWIADGWPTCPTFSWWPNSARDLCSWQVVSEEKNTPLLENDYHIPSSSRLSPTNYSPFCSTWQAKLSHVFHLIYYYAHTQHHSLSSLALKSKEDRLSWLSSKATASCKLLLLPVNGQPKKTKDADNEEHRTGALQLRSILPILHSRHKRDQWLQIAIAAHNHLHILQQLVCASCKL
jgi:hypothetical protein